MSLSVSASSKAASKKAFYAVAKGRKRGIYSTWAKCEEQVKGFPGAKFKKFPTLEEAKTFAFADLRAAGDKVSSPTESNDVPSSKDPNPSSSADNLEEGKVKSVPTKRSGDDAGGGLGGMYGKRRKTKMVPFDPAGINPEVRSYSTSAAAAVASTAKEGASDDATVSSDFSELAKRLKSKGFHADPNGTVTVYTDGACINNGKAAHRVRAGVGVWWGHGHCLNVSCPLPDNFRKTNNVAEIQAAVEAVKIAKSEGIQHLRINTDSQFMINCITKWMPKWKRNGWKTASGDPVINKTELQVLEGHVHGGDGDFKVTFNHVRGHVGIEGNEAADRLANAGAAASSSSSK